MNPRSRWSFTSAGATFSTAETLTQRARPAARTTVLERTVRGTTAAVNAREEEVTADMLAKVGGSGCVRESGGRDGWQSWISITEAACRFQ
tara:strand:+ start:7562 stop:7834 length:273 start_codon:yes stop_codon:yes gene_type:complete